MNCIVSNSKQLEIMEREGWHFRFEFPLRDSTLKIVSTIPYKTAADAERDARAAVLAIKAKRVRFSIEERA